MPPTPSATKKLALCGAALLSFVMGSLHAYSVLLLEMETAFDTSRSGASFTYSLALIFLSLSVLVGHRLYHRWSPARFVLGTGLFAGMGCMLAAISPTAALVWIGFGVIFGAANGMAYGYALQFAGNIWNDKRGFAMGVITATYALGAVFFPIPLRLTSEAGGWGLALFFLACAVVSISALSAFILKLSQSNFPESKELATPSSADQGGRVFWLWLSYCGAVTAGLMVIGHAAAIAEARGGNATWILAAPVVIALANMSGSLSGGGLVDKISGRFVLSVLVSLSVVGLIALAALEPIHTTLLGFIIIGFCYGGTIAAFPAFISHQYGAALGTRIYGRVFTAWATAGLLGPYLAGFLFDKFGNYRVALLLAAAAAIISLITLIAKLGPINPAPQKNARN